jgi:hypothetical protein
MMARHHSRSALDRRAFLQAGGVAALGLSLPDLVRAEQQPRARSCILVYLYGGPSHIDLWDMKPEAPVEIRGEFRPAATRAPGIQFCELLPRLGQVADQLAVVRSMTHERNVHGAAVGFTLTGVRTADAGVPGARGPNSSVNDHPNLGSAVGRFRPPETAAPAAVTLPYTLRDGADRFVPGQTAGLLGAAHDPWIIERDPNAADFQVDGLQLPADLPARRLADRRSLLRVVESQQRGLDATAQAQPLSAHQQRVFSLLTSRSTQEAFELDREPEARRGRFGRHRFGQSCLLALRLIEAGVRFVQVNMGNQLAGGNDWDTHFKNFATLRQPLCPTFDQGFSALLEALRERGLLESTLVVVMGEFGRSPQVQPKNAGRDHWPSCYSLLLAGAGVRSGAVLGRSDKIGAYPKDDPVLPEDLAATVYHALGVPLDAEVRDRQQRPLRLTNGKPLEQLWR